MAKHGCCGLGGAGAVTPGACVLCSAGTYQTGSGPPWHGVVEGSREPIQGLRGGTGWTESTLIYSIRVIRSAQEDLTCVRPFLLRVLYRLYLVIT